MYFRCTFLNAWYVQMKPQDFFCALSLVYIGNEFGGNDMKVLGDVATSTLKCKM